MISNSFSYNAFFSRGLRYNGVAVLNNIKTTFNRFIGRLYNI